MPQKDLELIAITKAVASTPEQRLLIDIITRQQLALEKAMKIVDENTYAEEYLACAKQVQDILDSAK